MMEVSYAPDMFIRSDYYGADEFFEIQGTRGFVWVTRLCGNLHVDLAAAGALRGGRPPVVVRRARRVVRRLVPARGGRVRRRRARGGDARPRRRRRGSRRCSSRFAVYQASNERRAVDPSEIDESVTPERLAAERREDAQATSTSCSRARPPARSGWGRVPPPRRRLAASTPRFEPAAGRSLIALSANAAFLVVELVGGFLFGSLALVADAVHMTSDVLALGLALGALALAQRPPTERHTFGFERAEVLAAQANGLLLLVGAVVDRDRGVRRFGSPQRPRRRARCSWSASLGLAGQRRQRVRARPRRARQPQPARRVLAPRARRARFGRGDRVGGRCAARSTPTASTRSRRCSSRRSSCSRRGACSATRPACCSTRCPPTSTSRS